MGKQAAGQAKAAEQQTQLPRADRTPHAIAVPIARRAATWHRQQLCTIARARMLNTHPQKLSGDDDHAGCPVADFLVLQLSKVYQHLCGRVLNLQLLQNRCAVVRDGYVANVIHLRAGRGRGLSAAVEMGQASRFVAASHKTYR